MTTALITGVTGQDGSYLAEFLLAKGYRVVGVVRRTSHDSYERIGHILDRVDSVPADLLLGKGYEVHGLIRRTSTTDLGRIVHIQDRISLVPGDLMDQHSLTTAIHEIQPDEVYNLAAQSFVPTSWSQPVLTGELTGMGVTRMLEAVRLAKPDAKFYQASSSEMFGKVQAIPQI